MTTANSFISPFDASREVTFDLPDCKSATANRFGIGFGQRGFWGNDHYPSREVAESAWESKVSELRYVYGTPGKNWTGRFIEEEIPTGPNIPIIKGLRFVPLLKSGKRGKAIHTIQLYPIDVKPERIIQLSKSLRIDVR